MPPSIWRAQAWLRALVALSALCALLAPRTARAWVEVHVTGDDVRVTVDRQGRGRVEHRLSLRTAGSPLPSLDVHGVDPDAAFEPDGYVVPAKDAAAGSIQAASPVRVEMVQPPPEPDAHDGEAPAAPVARLRFDGRGLPRGVWVVQLRYSTRLAERGLLRADGALTHLRWTGPVFEDGFESARVTFVVPAAPMAPRVDETVSAASGPAANGPTFLSTVKRGSGDDEIQLVRPFVPKGEAAVWPAVVDSRAFSPRGAEAAAAPLGGPPQGLALAAPARRILTLSVGGALLVLGAIVVALKSREAAAAAQSRGAVARPAVALSTPVRAVAAGCLLTCGVGVQLLANRAVLGSALVLTAALFAAHRAPRWKLAARGPGRWLPVRDREVFGRAAGPRGGWLDASTRAGKLVFGALAVVYAAGVALLDGVAPEHAYLVALDSVVLLSIFGTGRIAELPPDPVLGRAPLLRAVSERVRQILPSTRCCAVRLVPRIRVPNGQFDADELRVAVVPAAALAGFIGIEVGVVLIPGVGTALRMPEILVRYAPGSECERALAAAARSGRVMRGRRPDERVLLLTPRLPTARMTAAIVAALATRVGSARVKPEPRAASASAQTSTSPTRAARSGGSGERTVNAGTTASPGQATWCA